MTTALLSPPQTRTPMRAPAPAEGPYRFTRAQYHRMGELGFFDGHRVELIRGEIVVMSPISWPHTVSKIKTAEIARVIFQGAGWVNEQSPVVTDDSEPEPDVAVYRGKFVDYFDHPTPADTLLIVEVAVTSLAKDTTLKAEFYAQEGVADYWVVDVEHRRLLVFREPSASGYQSKRTLGDADSVSPLAAPDATVRVADLLP